MNRNYLDSVLIDVSLDALRTLDLAEADAASASAIVRRAQEIITTYRSAVAAAKANEVLSPLGVERESAVARDKASRELADVSGGQLAHMAKEIQKLADLLEPQVAPTNDPARIALVIERRAILRQHDALENTVIMIEAAQNGDDLTLEAMFQAPSFDRAFKFDAQAVLKAKQLRAERERPAVAQSLRALRTAYSQLQSLLADAAREIGVVVDPVLAQAKGNGATAGASA
jgi:hypothetical protein